MNPFWELLRRLLRSTTPLAVLATLTGCASPKPLPTTGHVDLRRYSGKWFEIARVKNFFQRDDERAVAEYQPLTSTSVRVRNTAIGRTGKTRSISGVAEVVPGSNGARLRVKFSGFAALAPVRRQGNYWIISLDAEYRSAMVGTPDRKYLWILARSPSLAAETAKSYAAEAKRLGFPVENMIWDRDLGVSRLIPGL